MSVLSTSNPDQFISDRQVDLNQFLSDHRVDKGCEYTHTSLARPLGSFYIPPEKKPQLIDLLYETIYIQKTPVHLTEKPPQETLIKADLDFKFQLEENGRRYTLENVKSIVELYHNAIRHYLPAPTQDLKAFVFERNAPYKDRGNTKDGIHIMYPELVCDTKIQHLIRDYILLHAQSVLKSIGCKNSIDEIVDKSVISTNNWLMYGCSKAVALPYKLSHIFDAEMNDLNIRKYDPKTLMKLLSIRDPDPTKTLSIKPEHQYMLEKKKIPTKPIITRKIKVTKNLSRNHSNQDINLEEIRELARLLNSSRAETYATWMEVGLCLHNIDSSLLDSWIDFSRQSSKFKDGECENYWSNMDLREDGVGIGSLHHWAIMDNPKDYSQFTRQCTSKDILKSQSKTTQDVARVVHGLYKYIYKCASIKNDIWYEFKDHRWKLIDSGVSLRKKLGNEVINEYLKSVEYYNVAANNVQDDNKEQYIQKSKLLMEVTYMLRDIGFKEKIIKECRVMFYEPKFEETLDSNPDLIGFENGIYNLKTSEFRNGRPEDLVSLSTGIDYEKFEEDDEDVIAIYAFMAQVFVDEDTRNYAFILLASFLEGRNPNEKFHIWTGSGGNGKSKLLELFELAFGGYTSKVPVTVFTQKRGGSGSANPEVARLKGIRLVSTQEPEETEHFNVGIMKEWTGGDKITCRAMYREPFDFKPQFKIAFCCNQKPPLPPGDEGTWRRISVLDFLSRFCEKTPDPNNKYEFARDPHLTDKLHQWAPAFMFILLEHFKIYLKKGLKEPASVLNATLSYQKENDVYVEFIDDCIRKDETATIKLEDMFNVFKDWWKTNIGGKSPPRKDMKPILEKKLGKYLPSAKGGWLGYKLIDKGETADEIIIDSGVIGNQLMND